MKKTAIIALLAAALMAGACAEVPVERPDMLRAEARKAGKTTIEKTFTAAISVPTRTDVTIGATGKVNWVAGDEISVLDGVSNVRVTLTEQDISSDGLRASFTARVADKATYRAVYPYAEGNSYDESEDIITLEGPAASQDGTFGGCQTAVACYGADDASFTFNTVTAMVNFQVSDPRVASIGFRGKNGERLNGKAIACCDGTEAIADWSDEPGGHTLAVARNDDGDYFIGTLHTEFTKGFLMAFYKSDGSLYGTLSTSRDFEIEAGSITRLGNLDSRIVKETETVKSFPYSESFSASKGDFTIKDVNLPSGTTYVWTYTTNYGMKASAYFNKKNHASESWLISPFVDLTMAENAILKYDNAANQFKGNKPSGSLSVKASADGTNWTALSPSGWPSGSDWNFMSSGDIDLSAFLGGKVQIAFIYTSTSSVCGTWQVKNFSIDGASGSIPGGGGGGDDDEPVITIAEFNALEDGDDKYKVSGTITSIDEYSYGIFTIDDGTGSLYIYCIEDEDGNQCFTQNWLSLGDVITVYGAKTTYACKSEMDDAIYVSHYTPEPCAEFLNCTRYGIYRHQSGEEVKAFDIYGDQLGYGSTTFHIANPNTQVYWRISGLDITAAVSAQMTASLHENFDGTLGGDYRFTVKKVDGSTVWLTAQDGLGFIIKR